jgi:hypothetical protein
MIPLYSGGCACGAIRYQMHTEPIFQNHCQCRDCQRQSGAGHGSYLTFARRAEQQVSGSATTWGVTGDSGNRKDYAFCPTCGSPAYLTFSAMPDLIAVPVATLDDPGLFSPQALTYASRGHDWDLIDSKLPAFAGMPTA